MAKIKNDEDSIEGMLSDEARENRMISLAMKQAEKDLMNGTASSQVVTHFLKLGSTKEKLEKEILSKQKDMIEAKTEALKSAKHVEELYADALKAMREYSGNGDDNENPNI